MVPGDTSVTIRGGGIAAWCTAFLLKKAGLPVQIEQASRPTVPAILLSNAALGLLRDILDKPDMFAGMPEIRRRTVAWGANACPVALDHSGVVISEAILLDTIRSLVNPDDRVAKSSWLVISAQPLPQAAQEYRFGSRSGFAAPVQLRKSSVDFSCWIESVEDGWLFLIQNASDAGWLLGIGNDLDLLLDRSREIRAQVAHIGTSRGDIPVCPRLSWPMAGVGWMACGSAAVAFDPICGDGTSHAIREAILVSAVIRAASRDPDQTMGLLSHYEDRVLATFRKHLHTCIEFYTRGHETQWWQTEATALRQGMEWCDSKLAASAGFRYRLEGFELVARNSENWDR